MYGCESWTVKNWCFWTVVLEKTLESPLDRKEIQPFNPNANPFWIFIGRTNTETETPILWPPNMKNWLIRKDPDAGKGAGGEGDNRGQDGWMASPTLGHEFEKYLGDGEGQGNLACCSPWDHKESDRTEWLYNNILFPFLESCIIGKSQCMLGKNCVGDIPIL